MGLERTEYDKFLNPRIDDRLFPTGPKIVDEIKVVKKNRVNRNITGINYDQ